MWNPAREIYELSAGGDGEGISDAQAALLERRAAEGTFMQPYRAGASESPWRFRWVRVPTEGPERGAPYTVLGDIQPPDARPQGAQAPASSSDPSRQIQLNDALARLAAQRAPKFDVSLYEHVGVRHARGSVDRMVYHLEPRKDLPPERQDELWEALCSSPDVPPEHRLSPEDCQVRRWFREARAKMK